MMLLRHTLFLITLFWMLLAGVLPARGQANDPDVLEFALITDTHQYGSTADVRDAHANVKAFVNYCNATPSIQFALFGGDFYNAYDTNHEQGLACLQHAANGFKRLRVPFYATRGNHDCNGKCRTPEGRRDNTQIITDREFHHLFSPLSRQGSFFHPEGIVTDDEKPYGNYYYRDFEPQRVRIIVLNNYDCDSLETAGYHGRQMKWLTEQALDFHDKADATAWSFLILGHALTIDHRNNPLSRLLHAYVRGQDFFDTDQGVTYGAHFSYLPKASFIGFIYGHYHEDIYNNWDGYNMISVTRGYATGSEVKHDNVSFDHFIINVRDHTLEERRIGRGQTRFYSYDAAQQLWPGLSFPEADGMGHYTVGGRFGRIVHVTNLNDDGPGSLRMAIRDRGARTVVFDVEGEIQLRSPLILRHDSITLAGQSSPGAGITLMGAPLIVDASEVIIRYLRVNLLRDLSFGHHNLMIDHITAHNDTTSAIDIRRTEDVSVQYCRISTGSRQHPALLAGGFQATYHHNHIHSSARAIGFSDREGENRWIQVGRNLVTGWHDHAMYGGGHQGEFTIHENYFIPDDSTRNLRILDVADDGTARYWLKGNTLKDHDKYVSANQRLVNDRPGLAYQPEPADTLWRPLMNPVARPHAIEPAPSCLVISAFNFVYMFGSPTAQQLQTQIMRQAGCEYRPEPVCPDSIQGPHALAYLDRVVAPDRSIVILYDNDAHCQLDGYPYLAGQRDPIEADTAHVGIVSCGDFLQGGLAGSMSDGQAVIDVMNHVGYDAITLGTHEFDFDIPQIHKLFRPLQRQMVCANLHDIQADTLLLPPYVIRQYGRRRVAFVGVTTPAAQITNALTLSDEEGRLRYDFDPEHVYERVQASVDAARHEGADYVVVLSQMGYDPGRFGTSAPLMIAATTGIDAVLDGHTHHEVPQQFFADKGGRLVLYSQSGSRFANIGKLVIDPDGRVFSELIPARDMRFRDPWVSLVVDSIKGQYLESADDFAGRTPLRLAKPKEYQVGDTTAINAGYLVTDAMRWATDADIAWLNVGSIRNSLPAGELTRGDILEMVPYGNELQIVEIPGNQLEPMVRHLLKNLPPDGGNITPVSGLRIKLSHRNKRFDIAAIQVYDRSLMRYVPLDPTRLYRIVTTNYCINIGWRSHIYFNKYKPQSTGIRYNDAVFRYIHEQLGGYIQPTPWLQRQRVFF